MQLSLDTIDVQSEVQTDTGINPDDNDDNNTYTNIAGSRLYVRRLRDVRSVSERRYSILVSSATALRLPIRDYVIQPEGDGLTWTTRIQAVTAAETLKDVTNGINVELRYSKRPEDDTDFSATTYYRPADVVRKDNKHWFANVDSYGPWDEDNWTECYVHMEEAYAPEGYFINAQPIIIFNTDTDGNEDSTTLGNSFADDYTEAQLVSGVDYIAADQLLQNLGIDAAAATTLLIPQAEADRDADVSAQSWEVEFRRPTTIRLFGHAFEWAGYSNYSKALPQYQGDLSATNQFTYYFTNQDGGKVYGSGFNQDGLLVTPRGLTDVTTGEQLDLEAIGDSDRPIDLPEDPWTRAGTTLQPTNPGDDVNVTSAAGAVNIALEADGDSFFAGEMRQLGIVDIGGSLPGIGNIQLNVDGSGHFQGTVSVGNVVGASNTNTGVNVSDLGTVISQRKSTEGGSSVFAGKLGSETTSLVRANGSIILGPSTNPLFDVDALGDATTRLGVKGFLFNNVYHYEVNAFSGINGNLEAFSSIRLAQTGSDVSNDRGAFIAESNGSINAQINFDGSASFGGVIPASPNIELKANGTITIKDGNSFEAPTTSAGTNLFASGQAVFARNVTGAPIKIGLGVSDGTGPSNVTYLGIADAINADITGVKTKLFNDGSSQFAGDMEIGGTEASPNISLNSDGSSDFAGNMKVGDGAPTNGTGFRVDATGLLRCARTVTPVTGNPNCVSFFNAITNTKLAAFAGSNSLATTAQNPTYTSIIYNDGSAEFDGNITAGNVSFNLEADDETKYTATTDAEGNETRVYNGAVLDVKDRLTKADAALVALKSAAAAATDFASLQSAIATALANI